jgi:hypothetical protein
MLKCALMISMLLATTALAHADDTAATAPKHPMWGPWVLVLFGSTWAAPFDGWYQTHEDCDAGGNQARKNSIGGRVNYTCFKVPEGK